VRLISNVGVRHEVAQLADWQGFHGLKKAQEKGTRYPIQSYMIYQPPTIRPMKSLEEKLVDL
jgi:hypothetical protein